MNDLSKWAITSYGISEFSQMCAAKMDDASIVLFKLMKYLHCLLCYTPLFNDSFI